MNDVDVVVVGAGLAGLTAARALKAEGKTVHVLEARDRVGGRTEGGFLTNGTAVELGGQWIGSSHDAVMAMAHELGLQTFLTYDHGDSITRVEGENRRWNDETFGLDMETLVAAIPVLTAIEELAASIDPAAPWRTPDAEELDRHTLDSWLTATTDNPEVVRFIRLVVPALFSAEASEMSLLHFLFYMQSNGGFATLVATTNGAQEARVVGGTHQISERMAAQLDPNELTLEAPVHLIEHGGDRVVVHHARGTAVGHRVVVAVPPLLAGRLRYDPPMPQSRDGLTQQIPAGSVIKFQVAYERPFWRDQGLNGFVLSMDDAFNVTLDNSPPDASCGVLVGFLEGKYARQASVMSPKQRKSLVTASLVRYFGEEAANHVEFLERDWAAEEYTRGCYGGRLAPGVWTQYGAALAAPVGRVHWAGAETARISNGYMDGAVRSGYRVAHEILNS